MNVVSCTTWVRRGVAAAVPEKVKLTPKELAEIIKQTQCELQDAENDSDEESVEDTSSLGKKIKQEPVENVFTLGNNKTENDESITINKSDEYNFDKYDSESGDIHCSIGNIVSCDEDGNNLIDSDNDSEKEDDLIKKDDNLVLIGHVDGDVSILEIFVYNEAEGSFYCHHDILLPVFPLCLEWLNYDPSDAKPGNFCAIGSMDPVIEVWDLDLMDCLEPVYRLGRKSRKKKGLSRIGHKDAVLDLAWNENYIHVLASGSVDQTVLLWDLENGQPVTKLDTFNEKVQSLEWRPTETHQLLTGCADNFVRLFDCKEENNVRNWETAGEIERVIWNHFDDNYCLASTSNGYFEYFDIRQDISVWKVKAHEAEVTGLSLSSSIPGLLITSANDSVIKAWDILDNQKPELIWEKKSNLGALQCLAANPNNPFVFAVGGDKKSQNFKVIDFSEVSEVNDRFKNRNVKSFKVHDQNSTKSTANYNRKEEMMDVTEEMESMALAPTVSSTTGRSKMKKKFKK